MSKTINIYVGFVSKVIATSVAPFYQKEIATQFEPNYVIHYITEDTNRKEYGINVVNVLSKRFNKLTNTEALIPSFKSLTFTDRCEMLIHSTYERVYLKNGALEDKNLDWIIGDHEEAKGKIVYHLNQKIKFILGAENPDKINIIFNIGGGNSLHQMILSDIYFQRRLMEDKKLVYYCIYADYHGDINLYIPNPNDDYEIRLKKYNYETNIILEDYLSLECRMWKPHEKLNRLDCVMYDEKGYSDTKFNGDDLRSMWKNLWLRLNNTIENIESSDNLLESFNTVKGRGVINGIVRSYYEKFPNERDKDIGLLDKMIDNYNTRASDFSYKKLLNRIASIVSRIGRIAVNEEEEKLGVLFEIIVHEYILTKKPVTTGILEIYKNIHIVPEETKPKNKELDLVILTDKMEIQVFDMKTNMIKSKDIDSTTIKLQNRGSEYNKVKYVIPVNLNMPTKYQDNYIKSVVLNYINQDQPFFFFELGNLSKEITVTKNGEGLYFFSNRVEQDGFKIRNFLDFFS